MAQPINYASPLISVTNCSGINIEITRMCLVGGFPTILLDDSVEVKSSAKIFNNIIVKDILQEYLEPIPPTPIEFWDMWIPFE